MLVLIPVGVFVGISRVEVLESEMKGDSRSDLILVLTYRPRQTQSLHFQVHCNR